MNTLIDFMLYIEIFIVIAVLVGILDKILPRIQKALDKRHYYQDIEYYMECCGGNQNKQVFQDSCRVVSRLTTEIQHREAKILTPTIKAQISMLEEKEAQYKEKKENIKSRMVDDFKNFYCSKQRYIEDKTDEQVFEDLLLYGDVL